MFAKGYLPQTAFAYRYEFYVRNNETECFLQWLTLVAIQEWTQSTSSMHILLFVRLFDILPAWDLDGQGFAVYRRGYYLLLSLQI